MPTKRSVPPAINIGSRLEPMVDEALIRSFRGAARLKLHEPQRREIVFETDAPWEGNACGYPSIVRADENWRIYYHGLHYRHSGPSAQALTDHPAVLCYVESSDGLTWSRPNLGQFAFNRSKRNNIVLTPEAVAEVGGDPAHTAVLRDTNPDCPANARYKVVMLSLTPEKHGLYLLQSPDGVRFELMSDRPAITEGAFDSQNLMFWDPVRGEYREYHRVFTNGVRDIVTAVSVDPTCFPRPKRLRFPGAPIEHLYTNQILPYYRAPHIFMGFPARYTEREWSAPLYALPGLQERIARSQVHPRYGGAVTDTLFMTSRDGLTFKRWPEAFIRPGPRQAQSWVYGDNYTFWGMIETPSSLEDAPNEISLYSSDGYWEGVSNSFRRYTIRLDGFVSINAPLAGGEILTRPLIFDGGNLALNMATSGAGGIRVEIQDAHGKAIPGYALEDCPEIMGDSVRHIVRWYKRGGDVRRLSGKVVRLRFVLRDADLYSLQFVPYAPEPPLPDLSGIPFETKGP